MSSHERIEAVGDAWIRCRSHSYDGRSYYFNTLTGESLWNLSSEDISKAQNVDKPNHSYPEPKVPPTETDHIPQAPRKTNPTQLEISQALWKGFPLPTSTIPQTAPIIPTYNKFCTDRAHTYVETIPNTIMPTTVMNPLMPFPWSIPPGYFPPQQLIPINEGRVSVHNTNLPISQRFQLMKSESARDQPTNVKEVIKCPEIEPQVKVSTQAFSHTPEKNITVNIKVNDLRQVLKAKRQLKDFAPESQVLETNCENILEEQNADEYNPQDLKGPSLINKDYFEEYEDSGEAVSEIQADTQFNEDLLDEEWTEDTSHTPAPDARLDLSPLRHHFTGDGDWFLAPDTNVLIGHCSYLQLLVNSDPSLRLIIARRVDEELQLAARGAGGGARGARAACRFVERMFHAGKAVTDEHICVTTGVGRPLADDHILEFCLKLVKRNLSVVFLSNDHLLRGKSQFSEILAFTVDELKKFLEANRSQNYFDDNTIRHPINISFKNTPPTYPFLEPIVKHVPVYEEQRMLMDTADTVTVKSNSSTNSMRTKIIYDLDKPANHDEGSKLDKCDVTSVKSNNSCNTNSQQAKASFKSVITMGSATDNTKVTKTCNTLNYPTKVAVTVPLSNKIQIRPNVKPLPNVTIATTSNERAPTKTVLTNKVAPTIRETASKDKEPIQAPKLKTQTSNTSEDTGPICNAGIKTRVIRLKRNSKIETKRVQNKTDRKRWRRRQSVKTDSTAGPHASEGTTDISPKKASMADQSKSADNTSPQSVTSDAALKKVTHDFRNQTIIEESPTNSDVISNSVSSDTEERGVRPQNNTERSSGHRSEYGITDDCMEDNLRTKMDEWLSRFVQIMEETLGQTLRSHGLPWPVSLREAARGLRGVRGGPAAAAAAFSEALARASDGRGNIRRNVTPIEFMEMFRHGVSLINTLGATERTDDIQTALQLLSKLLDDIKSPLVYDDASFRQLEDCMSDNTGRVGGKESSRENADPIEPTADFDEYNTGNGFETPHIPKSQTVKFVRKFNFIAPFHTKTITKAQENIVDTPDVSVEEANSTQEHNKNDTINSDPSEGPKIVRSFTFNPVFEERLITNDAYKMNTSDFTNDEYHTESVEEMEEYDEYNTEEYDEYNTKEYDEYNGQKTETGVCEHGRNVEVLVKMFLRELKAVFLEAKMFCLNAYADLEGKSELSESRELTLRTRAGDYEAIIKHLVESLTCILDREARARPDEDVDNILMKNRKGVATSQRHYYRETVDKCRAVANVLLSALSDLSAAVTSVPEK